MVKCSIIKGMDKVHSKVHKMDQNILGLMYMINVRAMEYTHGLMVTNLKAFGKTMTK